MAADVTRRSRNERSDWFTRTHAVRREGAATPLNRRLLYSQKRIWCCEASNACTIVVFPMAG